MRLLCIGDLHAKSWIIDKVAKLVDDYDAIVFCGDYVDNWNASPTDSVMTLRQLKTFVDQNKDKVYAIIGNHDFAYIHVEVAGRSSGWDPTTHTIINSPENNDLKNWLLSLPVVFELDGVTFSHAGITEEWNGELDVWSSWNDCSPIWARPREFGGYITYKEITQVIGHNPSKSIWNPAQNVWCIDTFSEHRDNTPIGDYTVLEVINGQQFNILKLGKTETKNDNNNITSIKN